MGGSGEVTCQICIFHNAVIYSHVGCPPINAQRGNSYSHFHSYTACYPPAIMCSIIHTHSPLTCPPFYLSLSSFVRRMSLALFLSCNSWMLNDAKERLRLHFGEKFIFVCVCIFKLYSTNLILSIFYLLFHSSYHYILYLSFLFCFIFLFNTSPSTLFLPLPYWFQSQVKKLDLAWTFGSLESSGGWLAWVGTVIMRVFQTESAYIFTSWIIVSQCAHTFTNYLTFTMHSI